MISFGSLEPIFRFSTAFMQNLNTEHVIDLKLLILL